MTAMDYAATAAQMTDIQFELLLRARLRHVAQRYQHPRNRHLDMRLNVKFKSDGELESAGWTVCYGYGDDTKGERLEPALRESLRREGWNSSPEASLLLLDSPAPATEF